MQEMQGRRNWKWSLLTVLLMTIVPGGALAQARAAETQRHTGGPFAVQAGLGFTADPDAFLMNFEADFRVNDAFSVGAMLHLGLDDDVKFVYSAAYARYSFDLSGLNADLAKLTPFVQGGLGFTHIEKDVPGGGDDDDLGFLINFGVGVEYPLTDRFSIASKMLFNILPADVLDENFYYSWEIAALRYRF